MKTAAEKLHDILADIGSVYTCPECEDIWVDTGRHCDCASKAVRLHPSELMAELLPNDCAQPTSQPFHEQVFNLERSILRQALIENDLKVGRTAIALGFNHHQSLISILNVRHKGLREELGLVQRKRRKPVKKWSRKKERREP